MKSTNSIDIKIKNKNHRIFLIKFFKKYDVYEVMKTIIYLIRPANMPKIKKKSWQMPCRNF